MKYLKKQKQTATWLTLIRKVKFYDNATMKTQQPVSFGNRSTKDQLKYSPMSDESPTSVSDNVYCPAVKQEVKCHIVFHSPSKVKPTSSSSNTITSSAASPSTKHVNHSTHRSPRRRVSTGDAYPPPCTSRGSHGTIPLKDATLLALATRGTGYACDESCPGGVVVDEESRLLILKGEFFTPKKSNKKKRLSLSDLASSGADVVGCEDSPYPCPLSDEDKFLLELSQRPSFQSPDSALKRLLSRSQCNVLKGDAEVYTPPRRRASSYSTHDSCQGEYV